MKNNLINLLFFKNKLLGNFLVSKNPPHQPVLLDFGLTKDLSTTMKQGLAKMLLSAAEVISLFFPSQPCVF